MHNKTYQLSGIQSKCGKRITYRRSLFHANNYKNIHKQNNKHKKIVYCVICLIIIPIPHFSLHFVSVMVKGGL